MLQFRYNWDADEGGLIDAGDDRIEKVERFGGAAQNDNAISVGKSFDAVNRAKLLVGITRAAGASAAAPVKLGRIAPSAAPTSTARAAGSSRAAAGLTEQRLDQIANLDRI